MKNREQGKSELADGRKMRLFFALWPAPILQHSLYDVAIQHKSSCGGRVMRVDSIHMTLLFLGETPAHRLQELTQAAAAVRGSRFKLTIDCIRGWRHNAIVYVAPSEPPQALLMLSSELQKHVAAAGFKFDARDFTPHITLMRKTERMVQSQPIQPLSWDVDEFVLVQSVPDEAGMRYQIVGDYPLEVPEAS